MTDNLTQEDIQAIRERCEKATEGPWEVERVGSGPHSILGPWFDKCGVKLRHIIGKSTYANRANNAAFIAHSRTDIPRLLAALAESQRAEAGMGVLFNYIDMRDLAPVVSPSGGYWDYAPYCSESLHEHPTVPQFIAELERRAALTKEREG